MSDAHEKLNDDQAWRDHLDPAHLNEVDGPEVVAEANHYARALRALLELHRPTGWYCECPCTEAEIADPRGEHQASAVLIDDDYYSCDWGIAGQVCAECTPEYPDENQVDWPCPTVRAITDALEDR